MTAFVHLIRGRIRTLEIAALTLVVMIGGLFRFLNLGRPPELVFDEVYYVDGARDFLAHGVEIEDGAGQFIVHPPVGKWMIAIGIKLFGDTPFGWRFSAAVIGTLSILVVSLIARRLFDSNSAAVIAATLTALDGLHLVMSRTALLDIFLMFFLLLGLLAFLYDRHFIAAISLGLALGTKWNALYFIAALILYLGISRRRIPWIYAIAIPLTYLVSWSGWFMSSTGWDRNYSSNPLISWIHYHKEILDFHTGLTTKHSYQANPWSWLVLGRPTSFYYATPEGCGAKSCSQEILAMSTPTLWWFGIIALLATLGYLIQRRDRVALIIILGFAANFLPWLLIQERTMFYFYAITLEPFLILALVYIIQRALAPGIEAKVAAQRRQILVVAGFVVLLTFLYFLPLYNGGVLTYSDWYARMWLPSWI